MILEVGGETRPWGPRGKGYPNVSKGPKPPIQILQLLKNSPREAKRAHFRYILVPPDPTQEMKLMGPGGGGPSRSPPPRFLQPCIQPVSVLISLKSKGGATARRLGGTKTI